MGKILKFSMNFFKMFNENFNFVRIFSIEILNFQRFLKKKF